MERELFATRLRDAAMTARDFARQFVEEGLPDTMRFRVRLNSSFDGHPRVGDEVIYPMDGGYERASALKDCSAEQVVETLWRDGRVPEWIDVSVIAATGAATLLQLVCCGRFTAENQLLYHEREGRAPFHVTGPVLPPQYVEGQRFSICHRSECWSIEDIDHLRPHAKKIWSLELIGRPFDDRVLFSLPEMPSMEILELKSSPLAGGGLRDLHRHAKLRVLRVRLDNPESFLVPELSELRGIELFDIGNPPERPWGSDELLQNLPNLSRLTLGAQGGLFVDGVCPPKVSALSITAKQIRGSFRPPKSIDSLYLHLSEMGDAEVKSFLFQVKHVHGLDLSGTAITDSLAEELPTRYGLTYLNLVRTHVSEATVARIAAAHPDMKLLPHLGLDRL